ncbi:uncharacterized protein LOC135491569 [Lineus longissimus]|uniref:uncharacterized protein LOC135491569 n=1 Tax=Lineus longissimus TaxID=88925 RepID=UPI002B4D8490
MMASPLAVILLVTGMLSMSTAFSRRLLNDDDDTPNECYAYEDLSGLRQNGFECGVDFCCGDATNKYCCSDSDLAILALDNPDLEDWDAAEKESRKNIDINPYDYIIPVVSVTAFAVVVIVIVLCICNYKKNRGIVHDADMIKMKKAKKSKDKKEKKKFNKRKKKKAPIDVDLQVKDSDVPLHESGQPQIYHIRYPEDDPYHLPPLPRKFQACPQDGANGNVSPSSSAVWNNTTHQAGALQMYGGDLYGDVGSPPPYSVSLASGGKIYSNSNHIDINSMQ